MYAGVEGLAAGLAELGFEAFLEGGTKTVIDNLTGTAISAALKYTNTQFSTAAFMAGTGGPSGMGGSGGQGGDSYGGGIAISATSSSVTGTISASTGIDGNTIHAGQGGPGGDGAIGGIGGVANNVPVIGINPANGGAGGPGGFGGQGGSGGRRRAEVSTIQVSP